MHDYFYHSLFACHNLLYSKIRITEELKPWCCFKQCGNLNTWLCDFFVYVNDIEFLCLPYTKNWKTEKSFDRSAPPGTPPGDIMWTEWCRVERVSLSFLYKNICQLGAERLHVTWSGEVFLFRLCHLDAGYHSHTLQKREIVESWN